METADSEHGDDQRLQDNADARIALEEARLLMQQINDASNAVDQKANVLLGAATLVVTLVPALQISIKGFPATSARTWALVAALVLYVVMLVVAVVAILPRRFIGPIRADWKTFDEFLLNETERSATLRLLSGYLTQIKVNESVVARKARWVSFGFLLLFFILLAVLLAGLLP
jgi:hypothetical protein